ncbi:MAG: PEP-CTERM sorting domain-containing protein [Burkholderiaceae bacterium]|nr:MAG: PEP-CTERM sorting domain-containing protein [Burkholderiaceae bacterium]
MKHQIKTVLVAVALSLSAAGAYAFPVADEFGPNLVVNGDFETGSLAPDWVQSGNLGFNNIDSVGNGGSSFSWTGGSIGSLGYINQTLATVAGAGYNIHLFLQSDGDTPNEIQVMWDGAVVYDAFNVGSQGFTEIVIDPFASDASTILSIGTRNDPGFLHVDDVSVREASSVPEPMTVALLGLGLLGVGVSRRKAA